MIALGFDTATSATALGLRLGDGSTLSARDDPPPGQRPGHATRLLPLAEQLLAQAGIEWSDLQRIAVGLGPGTFTGLRVGIATARGLAQSLGVDLVGIGSLDALAHRAAGEWQGNVLAAIDARRSEVFAAAYPVDGSPTAPRALAPADLARVFALARVASAHVASGDVASADVASGDVAGVFAQADDAGEPPCSPDVPWLAVGNGAVLYRSQLQDLGIEVPSEESPLHRIDGAAICELSLHAPVCAPHTVLPDYLRRPDAEIALTGFAG